MRLFWLLVVQAFAVISLSCASCGGSGDCNSTTCLGCCDSSGSCLGGDAAAACGSNGHMCTSCGNGTCGNGVCSGGTGGSSGNGGGTSSGTGGSNGGSSGTGGGTSSGTGGGSAPVCPTGLMCDVACSGSATTSISGRVYDPAGKNALYNVTVFVPATDLVALPKGVPTGTDQCSCAALFPSGSIVSTTTTEDGRFTLTNVPVGSEVPLVIQIGKWRRKFKVNVTACMDNPQTAPMTFPSSIPAGDTDDNMPDIAVSTGSADTLECLMRRIGLPTTEYVAGVGTPNGPHVHVFSGGKTGGGGNGGVGKAESPAMANAPVSSTNLWHTLDQLTPYDIVLLSCEGGETYNANPPMLEQYLNVGGRVFGSHFHYSWFSGPISSTQSYTAPADWGTHLATWSANGGQDNGSIGGIIDTVLNGSTAPFPKGVALQNWLSDGGTLGVGAPNGEVSIYAPRYNAQVGAANTVSQPWITSDSSGMQGATMYFSFDTPVNALPQPDGGAPNYCGRAVFSDLHVAGNPSTNDNPPPPDGCDNVDLSPQEKVLEFMLFDLSSCVVSDTVAPPITIN